MGHPEMNHPIEIEAPWPKDLLVAVKYLRRYPDRTARANEA